MLIWGVLISLLVLFSNIFLFLFIEEETKGVLGWLIFLELEYENLLDIFIILFIVGIVIWLGDLCKDVISPVLLLV